MRSSKSLRQCRYIKRLMEFRKNGVLLSDVLECQKLITKMGKEKFLAVLEFVK